MNLPAYALPVYVVVSVATFVVYGLDKRAALRGQWRTRERTLHLLELAGGWPGALVAQRVFRHKTHDSGFRLVFFAIIGFHVLLWALWMARSVR